jgi:hypothetical protein
VEFLAETMAEACRHVFAGLPQEVWLDATDSAAPGIPAASSGPLPTLGGATLFASRLDTLNQRLVTTFRELLEGLGDGTIAPDPAVARDVLDDVRSLVATMSAV